ncbi:MAG TPA: BBE domain-containing protein, partial [Steroidobacteraceae bacterium]|nr:BBE domain-containing protein [Steroidobacteraceae bacterium]
FHVLWAGDQDQVGQFLHGYQSAWLPAALLQEERRASLAQALFEASRIWTVSLHFNKGLAGAPPEEITAARHTATNPGVLDAFALAIIAGAGEPAYTGLPGAGPDLGKARRDAADIARSMEALLLVAPGAGAYVSESDYFQRDFARAFWGSNAPQLARIKRKYDPRGVFRVHHGVGSGESEP